MSLRNFKTSKKIITKSKFTRLKKTCLARGLPQLINAVPFLEAAGLLISRGRLANFLELCFLSLKFGPDNLRSRHLQPGYYHQWLRKNDRQTPLLPGLAAQLAYAPKITAIITVTPEDLDWLPDCLEAIIDQWYPFWELYLIAAGGTLARFQDTFKNTPFGRDPRIFLSEGANPYGAVNEILSASTGEFVVFPGGRDLLAPSAFFEVVRLLNLHPEADIIYTDEDKVDAAGERCAPFFKPDWSPDLALSMPYTGQFTLYRQVLLKALDGIRADVWPAAHYDLLLRAMAQVPADNILHIPKILYHSRTASARNTGPEAGAAPEASRQALQDHLLRTSQAGEVRSGEDPGTYRIIRTIPGTTGVSIIIPFKDGLPLLSQCLTSIFEKTDYPLFEIILVNNQSQDQATLAYVDRLAGDRRIRLLDFPQPFNYAAINNRAVEMAVFPYVLFLNNDTEVISSVWLRAMVEHVQRDEVGAVGAKLLYPDCTIQHGGLTLGGGGLLCGDFFRGTPDDGTGHILSRVIRNCSAVTGACLLTKKHLFQAVGGFDEVNLPICYNDVDYCLKLRARGYLIVWTPYARLYHHESASRVYTPRLAELERLYREQRYFEEKWWPVIEHDPYYNSNLSRIFDGYAY